MIELMVVLAVAAILLSVGVSGFYGLVQNQRLTTAANGFFSALHLTRSEAIQRGGRVDLVPADSVNWANGWIIFIDQNANQKMDSSEHLIFSQGPVSGKIVIKSVLTDSSKPYIAYNGSGRTRTNGSSQAPQLGTISFSMDSGIRRIKLNFSGRARICNPDDDKTCTGNDLD